MKAIINTVMIFQPLTVSDCVNFGKAESGFKYPAARRGQNEE